MQLRQRKRVDDDGRPDADKPKPRITLETFDLYQKVRDEEQVQTSSGATVMIIAVIICLVLVASELKDFLVPQQREHMKVDPVIEGRLRINFDITFPSLTCAEVNLDAMDVAGEQQNGIDHDIKKTRLSPGDLKPIGDAFAHRLPEANDTASSPLPADYCGSCYGAALREGQCCNSCDDVRSAYAEKGWDVAEVARNAEQCARERRNPAVISKEGEGCRISGMMLVNKVAGNFHVAMGETHARGAGHIHQFNPNAITRFNCTHILHTLSFGEPFPGIKNPLDGQVRSVGDQSVGVFMYYIKVVPTEYMSKGNLIKTNQYSATSQYRAAIVNGQRQNVLPGVFFVYDVSPFMVTVTEHTSSFGHLVTSLCAILGGVLTMAGLIDSVIYYATRAVKNPGVIADLAAQAGLGPGLSKSLAGGLGGVGVGAGPGLGKTVIPPVPGGAGGPVSSASSATHGPPVLQPPQVAGGASYAPPSMASPVMGMNMGMPISMGMGGGSGGGSGPNSGHNSPMAGGSGGTPPVSQHGSGGGGSGYGVPVHRGHGSVVHQQQHQPQQQYDARAAAAAAAGKYS